MPNSSAARTQVRLNCNIITIFNVIVLSHKEKPVFFCSGDGVPSQSSFLLEFFRGGDNRPLLLQNNRLLFLLFYLLFSENIVGATMS